MRYSFDSFLSQSLEYNELPQRIEPERMAKLFQALLNGENVSETLIKGHMRLAMAIVAERANPRWADELVGTVFLELVKRIDAIRRRKTRKDVTHETLTQYLTVAMRRRRNDFLCTFPHICGVPPRTLRDNRSKGVEIELKGIYQIEDYEIFSVEELAREQETTIEVEDVLSLAIRTEDERRVINFRAQGYTYKEISQIYPLSYQRIAQLNQTVEQRFDILMSG